MAVPKIFSPTTSSPADGSKTIFLDLTTEDEETEQQPPTTAPTGGKDGKAQAEESKHAMIHRRRFLNRYHKEMGGSFEDDSADVVVYRVSQYLHAHARLAPSTKYFFTTRARMVLAWAGKEETISDEADRWSKQDADVFLHRRSHKFPKALLQEVLRARLSKAMECSAAETKAKVSVVELE